MRYIRCSVGVDWLVLVLGFSKTEKDCGLDCFVANDAGIQPVRKLLLLLLARSVKPCCGSTSAAVYCAYAWLIYSTVIYGQTRSKQAKSLAQGSTQFRERLLLREVCLIHSICALPDLVSSSVYVCWRCTYRSSQLRAHACFFYASGGGEGDVVVGGIYFVQYSIYGLDIVSVCAQGQIGTYRPPVLFRILYCFD